MAQSVQEPKVQLSRMEGKVPESMKFEGNLHENFRRFYQNFEMYLIATEKDDKADRVKITLFLNMIGPEGVDIYNILKIPEPNKFDSVISEFKKYCAPRRNKTYERFVFNKRNQAADEPFDSYLSDLKKLIQSCEYETQEDSILTDRLVLGTNNPSVQEKLLNAQKLTLETAIEICRNSEITKRQLESVRNNESLEVNAVKNRQDSGNTQSELKFLCKNCKRKHVTAQCPAFGKNCFKCGGANHFINACFAEMSNRQRYKR
ncbi:uncharacterized protein LOC126893159 [Diabrotica virgifera virgifera]|uniref:Uncharacterized protein n=1 Tax=Diabrotica virgifera virgifera TaxID=50390 RepID=A0ABM5L9F6_DIAVI|nr:uncharacterized protein LOC126893159 [Diabrotica virgifera virgifera]